MDIQPIASSTASTTPASAAPAAAASAPASVDAPVFVPASPTVRASGHGFMRTMLLLLIGAVLGATVGIPAFVLFLRTDAGGALLRTYVMTLPQWPDANTQNASLPTTPAISGPVSTSSNIVVPRAYATENYYTALNALASSIKSFGVSYAELVPLLTTINANALSHNYEGFFDLIVQAKLLVAQQEGYVADISKYLAELSSANLQTTDAETKSTTNLLVSDGVTFRDALEVYVASLDKLLSGSAPTAQQLADINSQALRVTDAARAFDTRAQGLFVHFGNAVQTTP